MLLRLKVSYVSHKAENNSLKDKLAWQGKGKKKDSADRVPFMRSGTLAHLFLNIVEWVESATELSLYTKNRWWPLLNRARWEFSTHSMQEILFHVAQNTKSPMNQWTFAPAAANQKKESKRKKKLKLLSFHVFSFFPLPKGSRDM